MMKRIILSVLFTILSLGLVCNAYALTARDLWPVKLGNQWTYMIEGQINDGDKFQAEVTHRSGGWAYIDWTDKSPGIDWGDRWWYMSRHSGNIWTWDAGSYCFGRVFNLTIGEGNRFTSRIPGVICLNGSVWEVADDNATVDTPVGTFKNCVIIVNFRPPCADAGLSRMIFAPKVGLVEYSWTTIAGGHTAKLIHAVVNGVEYTRILYTGGYSVCLNIDKITYTLTENRMPPIPHGVPPQYPDTLKVRLEIKNDTNETISFPYCCGQEYDFIIRDDSGEEVYRWSIGKGFTDGFTDFPTTKTLDPGESLLYEEAIELRGNDKNPIQPGSYTIEGLHTTALPQKAIAAFKIELSVVH
jgi:hypothetical protein